MIPDKKIMIINELLELMKNSRLNKNQKLKIMNLVKEEKTATRVQKERFMLLYGLNKNNRKNMKIVQIAKLYRCTPSAIRGSVFAMRCKLLKYDEEFSIIENIVNKCKMEMINYGK